MLLLDLEKEQLFAAYRLGHRTSFLITSKITKHLF